MNTAYLVAIFLLTLSFTDAQLPDPCPSKQNVVLGQRETLKCNIKRVQGLRQWSLLKGETSQPLDLNVFQPDPDGVVIKMVTSDLEDTTLQLTITHPVTGVLIQTNKITITVYGPPIIKARESTVFIGENDNANKIKTTITCDVWSTPSSRVQWFYKLSGPLEFAFTTMGKNGSSSLIVYNKTGSYQCRADNGYGFAIDNINVVSNKREPEVFPGIKSLNTMKITDNSVQFKVEPEDEATKLTKVFYMYTLYAENNAMKENHNGVAEVVDNSFTISGFPPGAYLHFHFATAAEDAMKFTSTEGLMVTLMPPAPQLAVTEVTSDSVTIDWREPWSATASNRNGIDFYELKYSLLTQSGGEFEPPSCPIEIKIPRCASNSYKIHKRSSVGGYTLLEHRAHNVQGYSQWSSLLISH